MRADLWAHDKRGKECTVKGGAHDCEAVAVFQLQRGEVVSVATIPLTSIRVDLPTLKYLRLHG